MASRDDARIYQPTLLKPSDVRYGEESPSGKYICRECRMFVPPEALGWPRTPEDWGRCTIVGLEGDKGRTMISGAFGSCGQWTYDGGRTAEPKEENAIKLSKGLAAYMESMGGGFGCRRCQYFVQEAAPCQQVDAAIRAKGCCMLWNHPTARLFPIVKG